MGVPAAEQRRVCQRSGDRCAFEGCRRLLTVEDPVSGEVVVLGEIAHIVAERRDGPRGLTTIDDKDRNRYPNLMLLCQEHHQLVDSQEAVYTVDRLRGMKEAHERWVQDRLGAGVPDLEVVPDPVTDVLYSTLLPVERMPTHLYGALTTARYPSEVTGRARPPFVSPFILHGERLWAFQDLREKSGPFADDVDRVSTERHTVADWLTDPDRERLIQQLLNRCLNKLTGHRGLQLDKEHHRYYFPAERVGAPRSVSYVPLNKPSATRKVVWQPTRKKDGATRNHWFHRGVSLRFILLDRVQDSWVLAMRPELHLTLDGEMPYPSKAVGRRVTRRKSRLFNYDLLAEMQFWRDYLSESSSRMTLRFSDSAALLISTSMLEGAIAWPGIPAEYAMPFSNVHFVDDLFTWAEGNPQEEFADEWEETDDDLSA
jgi:hypothetical protein